MKKTRQILLASAALALLASPALADGLSANGAVTTNYVFRGITQSAKRPAVQGGLDYDFGNGFAVGTWVSTIDFGDDSTMEWDIYGNYSFSLTDDLTASVGLYGYVYPYSGNAGPYDFVELDGTLSYNFGPFTWGAKAYWAPSLPDGFVTIKNGVNPDEEYYLSTGISIPVAPFLSLSGNVGYEGYSGLPSAVSDDSYVMWDLGATFTWDHYAVDLRYFDTDTNAPFSPQFATGPFYVATLSFKFP